MDSTEPHSIGAYQYAIAHLKSTLNIGDDEPDEVVNQAIKRFMDAFRDGHHSASVSTWANVETKLGDYCAGVFAGRVRPDEYSSIEGGHTPPAVERWEDVKDRDPRDPLTQLEIMREKAEKAGCGVSHQYNVIRQALKAE